MRKYEIYKGFIIGRDMKQQDTDREFQIFYPDTYPARYNGPVNEPVTIVAWTDRTAKLCRKWIDENPLVKSRCPICGWEGMRITRDLCPNGCTRGTGKFYYLNGSSNASEIWENVMLEVIDYD